MVVPILIHPFFLDYILPFVLVFTLIFAVLQKTKILGDGKKQIDSIVALIIGLILIAFPFAKDIVVKLMPFLAVSITILLVFMLLYGFVYGKTEMQAGLKITFLIIGGLALITVILIITGAWDYIYSMMFENEGGGQIWINVLLIVVMAGAVIAVVSGKKGESSGGDE